LERIGVFADTHANLAATRAITDAADEAGCARVWALGDFLGSLAGDANPVECFDLVMSERVEVVLAGNHELFITRGVWTTLAGGFADVAHRAAVALGSARRARLAELPSYVFLPADGVELVHGSLEDHAFGFVASAGEAASTLRLAQAPLVLCGHTHWPSYFEARAGLTGDLVAVEHAIRLNVEYELPASGACLNPGAGCDPRGARWLELRLGGERRTAMWHQTDVPCHGRKLPAS
jgi:predicted phosphodiesterase